VPRDLAALNTREMLAWDVWGPPLGLPPGAPVPEPAARRLDAVVTSFGPAGPARVAVDVEPDAGRPATT
jgi:hypothetical protein